MGRARPPPLLLLLMVTMMAMAVWCVGGALAASAAPRRSDDVATPRSTTPAAATPVLPRRERDGGENAIAQDAKTETDDAWESTADVKERDDGAGKVVTIGSSGSPGASGSSSLPGSSGSSESSGLSGSSGSSESLGSSGSSASPGPPESTGSSGSSTGSSGTTRPSFASVESALASLGVPGLLDQAGERLQRILGAMQEVADVFTEVPRQLWLLPIRFGFYPGLQRKQDAIPQLAPFPCARAARTARSPAPPASVHRLRPGDVRVVAALGDSLTAANGALAYSEEETRLNYRGVSATGGGDGTWREFLTLPNILKEFNPRLLGYAVGAAEEGTPQAGLNLGHNGALDDELLSQAKRLVRAVKADPFIDADNDWKLVNVLIGGNDLCQEFCYDEGSANSPEGHRRAIATALDYLQEHLPRTFVNLIHVPNLLLLRRMRNVPFVCYLKQLVLCSCLFGGQEGAKAEAVEAMLHGYWRAERSIAEDPRYDTDNFTVALQPFYLGVEFPDNVHTWFGEAPDLSYFAPDCFHFSQKGNALAANALWNNMLEPEGRKSLGWRPLLQRFLCPNDTAPYFFTGRNSRAFLRTGRQDADDEGPGGDGDPPHSRSQSTKTSSS